jgi:hypothetical protein
MEDLLYHPKFWEGERGYPLWGNRWIDLFPCKLSSPKGWSFLLDR